MVQIITKFNTLKGLLLCLALVGCFETDKPSPNKPQITVSNLSAMPSSTVVEGSALEVTYTWETTIDGATNVVCELHPGYGYNSVTIQACKGSQTHTHTYQNYQNYYVASLKVSKDKDKVERTHSFLEEQAHKMLYPLNEARQQSRNCGEEFYTAAPPLRWEDKLATAAKKHSQDMADKNYFSHISLDNRSPGDRVTAEGYIWQTNAENIAWGKDNYSGTLNEWLASPGHCKNIMDTDFKEFGAGYGHNANSDYVHYWTQSFGAR